MVYGKGPLSGLSLPGFYSSDSLSDPCVDVYHNLEFYIDIIYLATVSTKTDCSLSVSEIEPSSGSIVF